MFHVFLDWWHQQSWVELIGVIAGLLCVYLAAINNIWNWPFAIINVILYIYIYFNTQLYADMGLQVYLLGVNIYGWYYWSKRPAAEIKVPVISMSTRQWLISVIIVAVCTPLLGFTLVSLSPILHYKPAAYPYLDSFCTMCSIIAQIYLARKVLQNWLIWVFVDIIYVGVYIVKDLHATAFMYAVFAIIAAKGYLDWRKEYYAQSNKVL
ncbi:nicotinamide riboside transporter PnuC [Mucilaginibacter sp. KACC 22063]|uniref:nicotinamide riboside transporter PnuC n=1 Tax=Mucilaginibacter sp. KACC 22063 TaxID=3025666 RepID=UPI002366601A|nr:nicotinamide riboside transporter PnuC [Mucilaginibacter sp. KACC 22063]WDF55964.1 nicotinamide riboside transporter PnuC [Mucilaginibacter sp. KACC 22063]